MLVDIFQVAPGLLLAAFFGSLIQRIAGMGFGIILSGFVLAVYEPFTAVYIGAIIGMGVTVTTMIQLRHELRWSETLVVMPPTILGMSVGYALAFYFGDVPWVRALFQTFGLIVIVFAGINLIGRASLANSTLLSKTWVGGGATGFMTGTIGMPGPTIAPYFFSRGIVGTAFIASICPLFFMTSGSRIILGSGANFNETDLQIAFVGAFLAMLAVFVGGPLARFVNTANQRRMIMALALVAAARLGISLFDGVWSAYAGL
ncbi:MAG: TSUP family transporter [Alphaproteobacteria bacterium]